MQQGFRHRSHGPDQRGFLWILHGGQYASRFAIEIKFDELSEGEHKIGFVAKLADGTVALLHSEITLVIKNTHWTDKIYFAKT